MADKFIIQGGRPLQGEIEVKGAKNAAFPILAATLLTKEECQIENLPLIEDVFRMIEILKSLGVKVEWIGERTIKVQAKDLDLKKIREDLICLFRGSVLLLGPLLVRLKSLKFPRPGGCLIGVRPIDTHLDAFLQLGAKISFDGNHYFLKIPPGPYQQRVILNEFSVTTTENLLLFSAQNPGKIEIKIADSDYQVQELCKFLRKMGVKILGAGTHSLTIYGTKKLKGAKHRLIYDPIEAGTLILMAASAKGKVLIKKIELPFLEFTLKKLRDFGLPLEISKNQVKVFPWKKLKIDKIQSLPHPGIPSDLLSSFGVLATQTQGSTLIHDPLYEGRLKYLEELNRMGADIVFCDPHRAIINGPSQLYGREIKSPDLRGGAALVVAGLIAKGKTIINNVYQIDRGYEKIEQRLRQLGAEIKRVKD